MESAISNTHPSEDQIREALREVIDPEVGINIVDLGLVYGIKAWDGHIHVAVTMTTPACPLGEYITDSMQGALQRLAPETKDIQVNLVWDPPWRPSMMSDDAKAQLGWAGD